MRTHRRQFRVFVSSTFVDMKRERDILQAQVFPRLAAFAEENQCDFLPVDLRWGIAEAATLRRETEAICLEELKECIATGLAPQLLVLAGRRYGWRPAPDFLEDALWREIERRAGFFRVGLMRYWYTKDGNDLKTGRRLRQLTRDDEKRWRRDEPRLVGILEKALSRRNANTAHSLTASMTEREIETAVLEATALGGLSAIALSCENAAPSGEDKSAAARAQDLRARIAAPREGWRTLAYEREREGGVAAFAELAEAELRAAMATALRAVAPRGAERDEPDAHRRAFTEYRPKRLHGAHSAALVAEALRVRPRACVVTGTLGAGKSAFLAEIAAQAAVSGRQVIVRAIGATVASTQPAAFLRGLCDELAFVRNQPPADGGCDLAELRESFLQLIVAPAPDRPVTIIIDDADQYPMIRSLTFEGLNAGLQMIFSAPPEFVARGPKVDSIAIAALSRDEGGELLDTWLAEQGRRVQPRQREAILDCFDGNPYWLQIVARDAVKMRSEDAPRSWPRTIPALIKDEITPRLASKEAHGFPLFAAVITILTSAVSGVTLIEMLEALALDDAFWNAYFHDEEQAPPVRAMPAAPLLRVLSALGPLVIQTERDGASLLSVRNGETASSLLSGVIAAVETQSHLDIIKSMRRTMWRMFNEKPWLGTDGSPNLRKLEGLPSCALWLGQESYANSISSEEGFFIAASAAGKITLFSDHARNAASKQTPETPQTIPIVLGKCGCLVAAALGRTLANDRSESALEAMSLTGARDEAIALARAKPDLGDKIEALQSIVDAGAAAGRPLLALEAEEQAAAAAAYADNVDHTAATPKRLQRTQWWMQDNARIEEIGVERFVAEAAERITHVRRLRAAYENAAAAAARRGETERAKSLLQSARDLDARALVRPDMNLAVARAAAELLRHAPDRYDEIRARLTQQHAAVKSSDDSAHCFAAGLFEAQQNLATEFAETGLAQILTQAPARSLADLDPVLLQNGRFAIDYYSYDGNAPHLALRAAQAILKAPIVGPETPALVFNAHIQCLNLYAEIAAIFRGQPDIVAAAIEAAQPSLAHVRAAPISPAWQLRRNFIEAIAASMTVGPMAAFSAFAATPMAAGQLFHQFDVVTAATLYAFAGEPRAALDFITPILAARRDHLPKDARHALLERQNDIRTGAAKALARAGHVTEAQSLVMPIRSLDRTYSADRFIFAARCRAGEPLSAILAELAEQVWDVDLVIATVAMPDFCARLNAMDPSRPVALMALQRMITVASWANPAWRAAAEWLCDPAPKDT